MRVPGQEVFAAPHEGVVEMTVKFSPDIARWLAERYPDGERAAEGSYSVKFRSASVDWAVCTVPQYGPEAEIVAPLAYREAMKRALAS